MRAEASTQCVTKGEIREGGRAWWLNELCLNGFWSVRALFSCWQSDTGAEARSREGNMVFRVVYIYKHIYIYIPDKGLHYHPFMSTILEKIDT